MELKYDKLLEAAYELVNQWNDNRPPAGCSWDDCYGDMQESVEALEALLPEVKVTEGRVDHHIKMARIMSEDEIRHLQQMRY